MHTENLPKNSTATNNFILNTNQITLYTYHDLLNENKKLTKKLLLIQIRFEFCLYNLLVRKFLNSESTTSFLGDETF